MNKIFHSSDLLRSKYEIPATTIIPFHALLIYVSVALFRADS